jgi:hypothetical protein
VLLIRPANFTDNIAAKQHSDYYVVCCHHACLLSPLLFPRSMEACLETEVRFSLYVIKLQSSRPSAISVNVRNDGQYAVLMVPGRLTNALHGWIVLWMMDYVLAVGLSGTVSCTPSSYKLISFHSLMPANNLLVSGKSELACSERTRRAGLRTFLIPTEGEGREIPTSVGNVKYYCSTHLYDPFNQLRNI